jgi:copper chaperone CopZ
MTRTLVLLLLIAPLALALPACKGGGESAASDDPARAPVALVMDVHGMTCGSCEAGITGALLAMDGVSAARAAHAESKVWVTYDPGKLTPEQLKATIDGLGYDTAGWSTEP